MGKGSALLTIGDGSKLSSYGNAAHSVFANRGGEIELGNTTILAEGAASHGIYAETGATAQGNKGGHVYLNGNTDIQMSSHENKYAMYASGSDSVIATVDRESGDVRPVMFNVLGNLKADKNGLIDLSMDGGSHFNGSVNSGEFDGNGNQITEKAGPINLTRSGKTVFWI